MSREDVIKISNVGKMYKIYNNPRDKFLDAMGLNFWKKNYYTEFWALRGMNIEIKKGEKVGLIGRNGAGKSTLLKSIIGSIEPTEGSITINGKIQALMELGTGFHPEFTGRENIRASLAYNNLTREQILEKEAEIIDFSELEEFIDRPIKTYSNGMLARLGFSTATAIEPEVLIIDEVLGAGDAYFSGKCVERMKKLTDESGATVLFVSHDLGSLQMLCDRSIWIDRGKVLQDGDTLEIIKNYSEEVRRSEEIRQQARNKKLISASKGNVDTFKDIYDTYLFRFIGENGKELGKNKIRSITLKAGEKSVGKIEVGQTMDNNKEYESFIISDIGLVDWSESRKDNIGFYRYYEKRDSKFGHAPFQFNLPKGENIGLQLEIWADTNNSETVRVEVVEEDSKEYRFLGYLEKGNAITHLFLDQEEILNIENAENTESVTEKVTYLQESRDIRFTEKCKINSVKILDENNQNKTAFSYEEGPKKFEFCISLINPKVKYQVIFLVFNANGVIEYSQTVEIENVSLENTLKLEYELQGIKFGAGEYSISFAVYDSLNYVDNTKQQEYIALIDRGIFFKISEPLMYKLGTGVIVPKQSPNVKNVKGEMIRCRSLV